MGEKSRRRDESDAGTPVVVVPKQSHDAIERRQRIREAMHDEKAVTVRARPRSRRRPSAT